MEKKHNKKDIKLQKQLSEQEQIELIKKDPREIYNIENPSQLIKNLAINEFRKKWER